MANLDIEDYYHVQAAAGWLGLGETSEAEVELNAVSSAGARHPDVLQVRWQWLAHQDCWGECLDIAVSLTQIAPERRVGWIHEAFSLHKLHRTEEACEVLQDAMHHFGPNPTMAYYLARYNCCQGKLEEARTWLAEAFEWVGDREENARLRKKVLTEPELQPLLKEFSH
jgi:predicted Zn-dependent protease